MLQIHERWETKLWGHEMVTVGLQRIFQRKKTAPDKRWTRKICLLIIFLLPSCLFRGLLGELLIDGEQKNSTPRSNKQEKNEKDHQGMSCSDTVRQRVCISYVSTFSMRERQGAGWDIWIGIESTTREFRYIVREVKQYPLKRVKLSRKWTRSRWRKAQDWKQNGWWWEAVRVDGKQMDAWSKELLYVVTQESADS